MKSFTFKISHFEYGSTKDALKSFAEHYCPLSNRTFYSVLFLALLTCSGCGKSPEGSGGSQHADIAFPKIDLSGLGSSAGSLGGSLVGSTTGSALSSFVDQVTDSLKNLGHSVGGDVMVATDHAAETLAKLNGDFRKLLHDQVDIPIANLGFEAQSAAEQLHSITVRINAILNDQSKSLFTALDVFTAGIQTASLEAESGLIPWKQGDPHLFYYTFNGQIPNLVPKTGGDLTLYGFRLWVSKSPYVELIGKSESVLATLQPKRGPSNNALLLTINPTIIHSHAGESLYLRVYPVDSKGNKLQAMNIPIVVPADYATQFRIKSHISYPVTHQSTRVLETQNFRFDNNSCEVGPPVSLTRHWGNIPPGGRIVTFVDHKSEERNGNAVVLHITSSSDITASGSMDKASCARGPFGIAKFIHSAIWSHDATPTIEFTETIEKLSDVEAVSRELEFPTLQTLLEIPKEQSETCTFWFETIPIINGKEGPLFFQCPRTTTGSGTMAAPAFSKGGIAIEARFNPVLIAGKAQLAVTFTSNARLH